MEKINMEEFPTSESARKMLSYVSDGFYDESYVGKWIFQAMGEEYDKALEIAMDLPAQFFPETATWGLMYHEIKWGLPVRENLSYEDRRKLIYQKRDQRVPMTPYRMEIYLKDIIGLDFYIMDCHDSGPFLFSPSHPNTFKITVSENDTNTELDFKSVENLVNEVKQSHTTFTTEHRQNYSRGVEIYAGVILSKWIGYEIYPRPVTRDIQEIVNVGVAIISDTMIFETIIRKEPQNYGN